MRHVRAINAANATEQHGGPLKTNAPAFQAPGECLLQRGIHAQKRESPQPGDHHRQSSLVTKSLAGIVLRNWRRGESAF